MTRKERMDPKRCKNDTQRGHLHNIEKWGVSILSVADDKSDTAAIWTYSIGFWQQYQHPEVILFGLDHNTACSLINEMNVRIRDRKDRFESGSWDDDILSGGYRCYFEAVEPANYEDFLVGDEWFYGDGAFPVVQVLWPDNGGVFPWQDNADPNVVRLQKLLCPLPKRALQ
jgi:hypothetical protein